MTTHRKLLLPISLAVALSMAAAGCGGPEASDEDPFYFEGQASAALTPPRAATRALAKKELPKTALDPRARASLPIRGEQLPGEEPGTPDEEPGTPDEEPGTPDEEPGTPDEEPGTPGEEPGTPGVDRFGVTMLYPSLPGGEEWYLADDPNKDPRFDPQNNITRNSDGSWKMKSSKVRMNVFTSTGYDTKKIRTYDRDELAEQGYMQAPNDWKNVEMTGFVKVNGANDMSDNFAFYARGGRHNDSLACEGSCYKGDLHYDGRVRWAKESWHVSYDYRPYKDATSSLKGRWVGWKVVMRNLEQNGETVVKLESYLNDNGDGTTWEKVYEWVDDGTWAGDHGKCGASNPKMAMTWGGPTATFRWDSATDVDFKWMSVREIQP